MTSEPQPLAQLDELSSLRMAVADRRQKLLEIMGLDEVELGLGSTALERRLLGRVVNGLGRMEDHKYNSIRINERGLEALAALASERGDLLTLITEKVETLAPLHSGRFQSFLLLEAVNRSQGAERP